MRSSSTEARHAGLVVWLCLLATAAARAQEPPPPEPPVVLGAPAALAAATTPTIELPAGTSLYREPRAGSQVLVTLDVATEVELLEASGEWTRVRVGGFKGWVSRDEETAAVARAAAGRRAVPADEKRIARALELMGHNAATAELSGFHFYSDDTGSRTRKMVGSLVGQLAAVYRERFGLDPGEPLGEAIVLFSKEEQYRSFAGIDPAIEVMRGVGHTGAGVATTYVGSRDLDDVYSSLVHEVVHLFNRRVLGPEPPAWLEEGLCDDLAYSRIATGGRIEIGTLAGRRQTQTSRELQTDGRVRTNIEVVTSGPRAAVLQLLEQRRALEAPSLRFMMDLHWAAFVAPEHRNSLYAASALVVRFLLDGEKGRYRAPFQAYLKTAPGAGPDASRDLEEALGIGLDELEPKFWTWLGAHVKG